MSVTTDLQRKVAHPSMAQDHRHKRDTDLCDWHHFRDQHHDRCQIQHKPSHAGRPAQHRSGIMHSLSQRQTGHGDRVIVSNNTQIAFAPSESLCLISRHVGGSLCRNHSLIERNRLPAFRMQSQACVHVLGNCLCGNQANVLERPPPKYRGTAAEHIRICIRLSILYAVME